MVIHPLYIIPGILLLKRSASGLNRFWQIQAGIWLLMTLFNTLYFHQGNLKTTLFFLPLLGCQLLLGKLPVSEKPVLKKS
jgi:hypothetical protein